MALEQTKESLIRQVKELTEENQGFKDTIEGLKRALCDATSEKAKWADQAEKARAEKVNVMARVSKDKEGLVRQVESMRTQVVELMKCGKVAAINKFSRYIGTNGCPTLEVPNAVQKEDDWIGALIASHKALEVFKASGKWGGVPEAHADLPGPQEDCKCPVCILRREITSLRGFEMVSMAKKITELESENKVLKDENREHRKSAGPASEKAKAKAAADAKALEDAVSGKDRLLRENALLTKKLADAEAALAREKARKAKAVKPAEAAEPAKEGVPA
jgi:hypothetical protein